MCVQRDGVKSIRFRKREWERTAFAFIFFIGIFLECLSKYLYERHTDVPRVTFGTKKVFTCAAAGTLNANTVRMNA